MLGAAPPAEGYRTLWQDSDEAKLETQLTALVIDIIVAGEAEYRAGQFDHHGWLLKRRVELEGEVRKRREEAERKARERRLAEERARREHLFTQAQTWRTARDIRGFVAEALAEAAPEARGAELQAWARWALSEADALDPLKSGALDLPKGT